MAVVSLPAARRAALSVCREGCHDQLDDSACSNPVPAIYKTAGNRPPSAGVCCPCSSGQVGRPASTLLTGRVAPGGMTKRMTARPPTVAADGIDTSPPWRGASSLRRRGRPGQLFITDKQNPRAVAAPASAPPRSNEKGISELVSIASRPPAARAAARSPCTASMRSVARNPRAAATPQARTTSSQSWPSRRGPHPLAARSAEGAIAWGMF